MRTAIVALIAFAVGAVCPAHALSVRRLGLADLARHADRIVVARCVASRELPDRVAGIGVRETRFEVRAWIKRGRMAGVGPDPEPGSAAPGDFVVRHLRPEAFAGGGPGIAPGDEVVLFLHGDAASGLSSPVGMHQGIFRIARTNGGMGATVVVSDGAGAAPSSGALQSGGGSADGARPAHDVESTGARRVPLETFLREVTRLVGDESQ